MKPKGILFRAEMIRALLNTQCDSWPAKAVDESKAWKWQTRRELKNQPGNKFVHVDHNDRQGWHLWWDVGACGSPDVTQESVPLVCPHPPGSILYAKETYSTLDCHHGQIVYRADGEENYSDMLWKPSTFMPKAAARLWFRVMNVRVERVNEISELDAKAEGVKPQCKCCYGLIPCSDSEPTWTHAYSQLWDSINGIGDFEKGKYVWVYEISRITKPV